MVIVDIHICDQFLQSDMIRLVTVLFYEQGTLPKN